MMISAYEYARHYDELIIIILYSSRQLYNMPHARYNDANKD